MASPRQRIEKLEAVSPASKRGAVYVVSGGRELDDEEAVKAFLTGQGHAVAPRDLLILRQIIAIEDGVVGPSDDPLELQRFDMVA